MDPTERPDEAFFGFVERPFSLTPDPKYYFRSRSHGRAPVERRTGASDRAGRAALGDRRHLQPARMDVIYGLSGGVARLVNLLGERALQEAATLGSRKIEPGMIDSAASALQLLRLRPKRFRWFDTGTR